MKLQVVRIATVFFVLIGSVFFGACPEPSPAVPLSGPFYYLDSTIVLDIPDGALDYTPILNGHPAHFNPISLVAAQQAPSYPDHPLLVNGSVYDLGPDGFVFSRPVLLSLSYSATAIPETLLEAELRLRELINGQWVEVSGSRVDTAANTVSGQITALGIFGVMGVPVETVTVEPGTEGVEEGSTIQLYATVLDTDSNALPLRSISWSSSNVSVAVVDSTGLVAGIATGSATITATSEGKNGTSSVSVTRAAVASVEIVPSAVMLTAGASQQLGATVLDAAGNPLIRAIAWSSSDVMIATVSGTGLVRAIAAGAAIVWATSEGHADTVIVTVQIPPVAHVQITPASSLVDVGQTVQLTAVTLDAAYNPVPGATVVWLSDNRSIATVTGNGLVTGISVGTTTITATSQGESRTAAVAVAAAAAGETLFFIDFDEYAVDEAPVPLQSASYTWTVPPPPWVILPISRWR
jgi:uncharacterized protein YjdB